MAHSVKHWACYFGVHNCFMKLIVFFFFYHKYALPSLIKSPKLWEKRPVLVNIDQTSLSNGRISYTSLTTPFLVLRHQAHDLKRHSTQHELRPHRQSTVQVQMSADVKDSVWKQACGVGRALTTLTQIRLFSARLTVDRSSGICNSKMRRNIAKKCFDTVLGRPKDDSCCCKVHVRVPLNIIKPKYGVQEWFISISLYSYLQ